MKKIWIGFFVGWLGLFFCGAGMVAAQAPVTYNSADIYMQLKKLNVLASVLYVAAHPDDENNGLLPFLAKEKLYRTGYLSLTRGDGGQNLIGSEQGIELGLIRTQELLAARRIDGAEQYFTRAYEFGYSKSAAEALRIWDREKVLSDAVWVIRQFQPDVLIARFPGDARAGHGHHAASSIIASEAFKAAADPNQFTEQFKYGVKPWQAKRLLWNTFNFGGTNTTSNDQFRIEIGGYNALLGKSYGELGGEARSMHKSQGEGRPRRRGQVFEYFQTLVGDAPVNDLMDGIVTDWKKVNGGDQIQEKVNAIIATYQFEKPEASVPALVELYRLVKAIPPANWRNKKLDEIQQLIETCSALFSEATTSQDHVVQGDTLRVNFFFNKRKPVNASVKRIVLQNFDSVFSASLLPNTNLSINKVLPIAANQKISHPYWLEFPKTEGTFEVRDQLMIGKAENDPAFEAVFTVTIEGEDFSLKRPVQYKVTDLVKGELYQPLVVLPKLEMSFARENYVSLNGAPVYVTGQLQKNTNSEQPNPVLLPVKLSDNWMNQNPAVHSNTDLAAGVKIVPKVKALNAKEVTSLVVNQPEIYAGNTRRIAYDHIPTITYFPAAEANLVKLDIKTAGKNIGYLAGAGDKVAEALEQLGYRVVLLNEQDITDAHLKSFDAIVVGIRAYNIHEYLTDKNEVLSRYVQQGGNLIIQYIRNNLVGLKRIKVGPYPFSVNASSRITEENAPVRFLLPQHPVLNYPNKITQQDFDGWVQERSTYQAEQLDAHFQSPLAMNDGTEKESSGSLVTASYGKGNIAYVSLVLFRQLPAGVPGAYRLLANLIALPKSK